MTWSPSPAAARPPVGAVAKAAQLAVWLKPASMQVAEMAVVLGLHDLPKQPLEFTC